MRKSTKRKAAVYKFRHAFSISSSHGAPLFSPTNLNLYPHESAFRVHDGHRPLMCLWQHDSAGDFPPSASDPFCRPLTIQGFSNKLVRTSLNPFTRLKVMVIVNF